MSILVNMNSRLYGQKWMMEKCHLDNLRMTVNSLLSLKIGGVKGWLLGEPFCLTKKENSIISPETSDVEGEGDIGIINISGILSKGPSEEEQVFLGLTDIDEISNKLDEYANDPTVSKIILCFASPGGETTGIEELGRKIKYIDANVKPCFTWTEKNMHSAAFWLGSQSRLMGMTPSADVGGCGVYMLVPDASEKYKMEGVNVQAISSGKFKMMGHDIAPLSEEEKKILLDDVKKQHDKFKQVIQSKRPDIKEEALEGLGYEGEDALENGMVDLVVDSFDEFLQHITANI